MEIILKYSEIRFILGVFFIVSFIALIMSIFRNRHDNYSKTVKYIISKNVGVDEKGSALSFYKNEKFFKMVNAGENLCSENIKFDFNDYCGNTTRMYYQNKVEVSQNETGN